MHVFLRSAAVVAFVLCIGLSQPASAEGEVRDLVDAKIQAAWSREKLTAAPLADDATFLRRIFLDLTGTIPTFQETAAFLEDKDPQKRAKLIDRLLDDPGYAQHQADVWDMVFFGRNPPGYQTDKRDGFRQWLKNQFAQNVPYDVWVKELLRAKGNSVDDGPPIYYAQYKRRPEDATEAITQTFLGIQLQCARCHDHPYEEWTQVDFYGMAAFLARLDIVHVGKAGRVTKFAVGEKRKGEILFTGPASEQEPGKKGEPIQPKFLLGKTVEEPPVPEDFSEPRNFPSGKMPPEPAFSRKDQLADWIADRENPFFARAVANRVWSQFLGKGLVHPVDNMSPSNPPSHPELLDGLTSALIEHNFDLKWYIRELCNSRTYQLASAGPEAEPLPQWFQRARIRPLSAEELLSAWRVAVGYDQVVEQSGKKPSEDRYAPLGSGYLLRFFGKPNDGTGNFQGGLHEHLYMNNGGLGRLLTTGEGSLHHTLTQMEAPWETRVERLFLSVLNRPPSPQERTRFVQHFTADADNRDRLQEAIWALMTCSEFRFNH